MLQGNPSARRTFLYHGFRMGIWAEIWQGEMWRPLTTTLLHGSLVHLLMNAMALFGFGPVIENRIGPWRMLGLIVLL